MSKIYLVTGNDSLKIKHKTNELIKELVGDNPDTFSFDLYLEDENNLPNNLLLNVIKSLKTPSFFSCKTICLRQFSKFKDESSKEDNSESTGLNKYFEELIAIINSDNKNFNLILSGEDVDARKGLYKACKKHGEIFQFKKPEISDRNWSINVRELITKQSKEKGISLSYDCVEYLVNIIGTDTAKIENEIEKICCYSNGQQITLTDLTNLCYGNREGITWEFTGAICERNTSLSISMLNTLLSTTKDANQLIIGIILGTSNAIRLLLMIKVFMRQKRYNSNQLKTYIENSSPEEKKEVEEQGFGEVIKLHPYRAKILADQSNNYMEKELAQAMLYLRDCNLASVSERINCRTMLEEIIFKITNKSNYL